MPRPSVFPAQHAQRTPPASARAARKLAFACAFGALPPLSGCYYYPYGYGYGSPSYYGTVPAASTQQETAPGQTSPAPNAVPDAQYPGPLYPSPPVAIAVPAYSAWPAYPAYYPSYPAWGWGAPAVSFGFGYWGGGGRWR